MNDTIRSLRDFFVSLKLTVVLLVLGMILVLWATLAQVDIGIWGVQHRFFRKFLLIERVPLTPLFAPFPGGYTIGGLLLINLIAAHIYRFKFAWRKLGIFLTHIGLILLLIGELLTGLWQEDYSLRVTEGETKNYSESFHHNELAIVDTTDPNSDEVVAIPDEILARGGTIQHPKLPFQVVVKSYHPNAALSMRNTANASATASAPAATTGIGLRVDATPIPITYKQDERNLPAAFIELVAPEGSLGTFMVSAHPNMVPQRFEHGGRSWKIALRFERVYHPFSLTLLDFSHDRYAGTEIPKNFSSRVKLTTPEGRDDREVLIYMNNPLRYAGLTFYQASFERGDKTSILQVVRNPSWLVPYIACTLMTLGLVLQFGQHLLAFVQKRRAARLAAA